MHCTNTGLSGPEILILSPASVQLDETPIMSMESHYDLAAIDTVLNAIELWGLEI